MTKFTISILALNGLEMTRRCIDSVLRQEMRDTELILTDNGTTDGTADYFDELARTDRNIRVVHNRENLGFGVPNNHALDIANGEFFVTLNNDAEVPEGWLSMLQSELTSHPNAGLAGASGTCNGFAVDAKEFFGMPTNHLEYIEGSCMMGRAALLRKVGLFSPYIKLAYGEDVDLSLRIRALGYSIHQAPFAIKHHRAASSYQVPNLKDYQAHNAAALLRRWRGYLKTRNINHSWLLKRRGALGDVILLTPIVRELRSQHPNSQIFIETDFPEVFENNPYGVKADKHWSPASSVYVVDMNMTYENRPGMHVIDAYADGLAIEMRTGKKTEWFITESEWEEALPYAHLSNEAFPGSLVSIHAGPHHWPGKHWPTDRFVQVAEWLRSQGCKVVLVGQQSVAVPCDLDLTGKTSLRQLAAVLNQCDLHVGLDSGPMHVAQAVGTPTIGVFGCTSSKLLMTDGSPHVGLDGDPAIRCTGVRHRTKGALSAQCSPECIRSVAVESVIEACKKLL